MPNLKSHQQSVLDKLRNQDALLVYHNTGSGKTLTSLMAGKQEDLDLTVIGPASLKYNFEKEKTTHKLSKPKVDYYTYSKPPSTDNTERLKERLLVFDEAHLMGRLESERSKYPDRYKGKKQLLLTATPIRNEPSELIPLLRGLNIPMPRDRKTFEDKFIEKRKVSAPLLPRLFLGVKPGQELAPKNISALRKLVAGKVDYHVSREGYPDVKEESFRIPMSPNQQSVYEAMVKSKGNPGLLYKIRHGLPPSKTESKNLNAFLSATRQISNTPEGFTTKPVMEVDTPKINKIIKEIKERSETDKNYKGVTYSNYLGSGVDLLEPKLTSLGIPYAKFTGRLSATEKKDIVDRYNKGKIRQLLISSAGAEGLDLKGTKLLQIMEPHWNEPKLEQVKGRVSRIGSHKHLPEAEREVTVQHFYSRLNPTGIFKRKYLSADEYLAALARKKENLNRQFLDILKEAAANIRS